MQPTHRHHRAIVPLVLTAAAGIVLGAVVPIALHIGDTASAATGNTASSRTTGTTITTGSTGSTGSTVQHGASSSSQHAASDVATRSTPITLTFAGDSVTHRPDSWMRQLDDPTIRNVGGVAIDGAPTAKILAHVHHVDADVLVVLAGTNDVRLDVPPAEVEAHIVQIADRVGARHVLISAIPPSDVLDDGPQHIDRRTGGAVLNRDLQQLAAEHQWEFVDPFAGSRTIGNGWTSGSSRDGVHPTDAVSSVVRDRIQAAVHVAMSGSRG